MGKGHLLSSYVGQALERIESRRLISGAGCYVGDIALPEMVEGAVLRSSYAHGRIIAINTSRASTLPGVLAIYTANDIGDVSSFPTVFVPGPELELCFQKPLARSKVRYVGEPLAFVVAVDRSTAEDALELIEVKIEPLEVIVDARHASGPARQILHEGTADNAVHHIRDRKGDVDLAMNQAPHRLRRSLSTQRHTGVPMETRGLLAQFEKSKDLLTVYGPTKMIHRTRKVLADLLKIPEQKIRCVEPDVGGGFGFRGEFFPEDFLVPWAAMRLNRPVRWIEDRQEHFLATNHSRQQWHDLEVGFDGDGRLLALRDNILMDMGAYIRPNGLVSPTHTVAGLPGPYKIPVFDIQISCVLTNKTPHGSYRGPGMFEACFIRERAIDMIAQRLGKDPADVRRINMIASSEMPYAVGTHEYGHEIIYDSGDYRAALDQALEELDYEGARALQRRERERGRYFGIGYASYVEPTGHGGSETARVALEPSGKVIVYTGTASIGQGVDTALAQVCADALDADFGDVVVRRGDTLIIPTGGGAWGSRTAVLGGSAVFEAARRLREKVLSVASLRLQAPKDFLKLARSVVTVEGKLDASVSFREIAALPQSVDLDVSYTFEQSKITHGYGTAAALVEVDPDIGSVVIHKYVVICDVGKAINPAIVEGQIVGGMAQGVGGTLLEELVYDEQGQLVTTTLADYLVPTAYEMPREVIVRLRNDAPSLLNPLGVKGAGEGGIVPTGAVLANAIADALVPFGVEITSLPLSHNRIWELVHVEAKL